MKNSGKNRGKGPGNAAGRPASRGSGPAKRFSGRKGDAPSSRGDKSAAGRFGSKPGTRTESRSRNDKPFSKKREDRKAAPRQNDRQQEKFPATAKHHRQDRDSARKPERQHDRRNSGQASVKLRDTARPPREKREHAPAKNLGPRPNMFGMHAVREAWLNPKRSIHALYLTPETERIFSAWPAPRVERPMPIPATKDDLERMLGRDAVHQGFALSAAPLEEVFAQDIMSAGADKKRSVVLMLDQVTDPHNVGAILRSACAFGADGVIMQRRHAPELEGVLCKTACGAVEHLPVAYETNLSRALEELNDAGYAIIGLDEHAEASLDDIGVPEKAVLVLGAEGEGMRRLVKEHCTMLVTLPTRPPIASLNVSNAAAVALYALLK